MVGGRQGRAMQGGNEAEAAGLGLDEALCVTANGAHVSR